MRAILALPRTLDLPGTLPTQREGEAQRFPVIQARAGKEFQACPVQRFGCAAAPAPSFIKDFCRPLHPQINRGSESLFKLD